MELLHSQAVLWKKNANFWNIFAKICFDMVELWLIYVLCYSKIVINFDNFFIIALTAWFVIKQGWDYDKIFQKRWICQALQQIKDYAKEHNYKLRRDIYCFELMNYEEFESEEDFVFLYEVMIKE